MRAVLCKEWGGPEKLVVEDVPSPAIKDGAVRIAVQAAGINFADLLLISGQYQEKPAFPFTPGMECSGTVTEVGAGVTALQRWRSGNGADRNRRVRGRSCCRRQPRLQNSRQDGLHLRRGISRGVRHVARRV